MHREQANKSMGATVVKFAKLFIILALTTDFAYCAPNDSCQTCVGCVNCINCEGCVNCRNLRNCKNCTCCDNCKGCTGCVNCNNCTDCQYCTSCDGCKNCYQCTDCTNLSNCRDRTDEHNKDCSCNSGNGSLCINVTNSEMMGEKEPAAQNGTFVLNRDDASGGSEMSGQLGRLVLRPKNTMGQGRDVSQ